MPLFHLKISHFVLVFLFLTAMTGANAQSKPPRSIQLIPLDEKISEKCSDTCSKTYCSYSSAEGASASCLMRFSVSMAGPLGCEIAGKCFDEKEVPFPCGHIFFLSKEEWESKSAKRISCPNDLANVDPLVRNKRISGQYAQIYLDDPDVFKWAGMAAFASDTVGDGIAFTDTVKKYFPASEENLEELRSLLATGNAAVYEDLYWQHLVFQRDGIKGMENAKNSEDLAEKEFDSWKNISVGKINKDSGLVWKGNESLLEYEQKVVLQDGVYGKNRAIFRVISPFMYSPVPGDYIPFQFAVPGGDIGDFKDRWEWLSSSMLPKWKEVSDKKNGTKIEEKLKKIVKNGKDTCKK